MGKYLLILLSIKPIIDLSYNFRLVTLFERRMSLLYLIGVAVFFFFGVKLISKKHNKVPHSKLLILFIFIHFISFFNAFLFNRVSETFNFIFYFIELMIRISDSFIIFHVAFLSKEFHQNNNYSNFLKWIFIGSSIAVIINALFITFGWSGININESISRYTGIYHDAGGLSNVALYNLIFASIIFLIKGTKRSLKLMCVFLIFLDLYLIYSGVSRTVIIQLIIFFIIYSTVLLKRVNKFLLAYTLVMVVLIIPFLNIDINLNLDPFEKRFSTEIKFLDELGESRGEVFYEEELYRLGSGRAYLWSEALDRIARRNVFELLFGNLISERSHSDYIDVLSRNGLIGLLLYILILVLFWIESYKLFLSRGKDSSSGEAIHILAFIFLTLYIFYAIPFRPLMYTTTAWYMWCMVGFSLRRRNFANK